MLDIDIPFASNTMMVDTTDLLFARIQALHPGLGITAATHYVKAVQQMPTRYRPWLSVAIIRSKTDQRYEQIFRYDRWPISRYVTNPVFTEAEIPNVQSKDEPGLVAELRSKLNLNINNRDFLIRPAGVHYTGGEQRPNWRLTAAPNSPFWYDDQVIWLHKPT